jgi:hypothetical protein
MYVFVHWQYATNKRNALKPDTLNALLYLRSNQDLDRSQ